MGHSLGEAFAALFYTRLLRTRYDKGKDWVLREAITFAAPAIGKNGSATNF